MDYFSIIKDLKLDRDENYEYTLGDSLADSTLGINNREVLTPDQNAIALFAATNYLFGVLGINVSTFTAVPAGFVASYTEDDEHYGTFLVCEQSIAAELASFCENKIRKFNNLIQDANKKNISGDELAELFKKYKLSKEKNELYNILKPIFDRQDITVLEKALLVSDLVKEMENDRINSNIESAKGSFDFANNKKNCPINDLIVCKIIAEETLPDNADSQLKEMLISDTNKIGDAITHGAKVEESIMTYLAKNPRDETYIELLRECVRLHHEIMDVYILPGYSTYMGKVPDQQNSQILNGFQHIMRLKDILGYDKIDFDKKDKMVKILNICSTDYSADAVDAIFGEIKDYSYGKENVHITASEIINSSIPTQRNIKQRRNVEQHLNDVVIK